MAKVAQEGPKMGPAWLQGGPPGGSSHGHARPMSKVWAHQNHPFELTHVTGSPEQVSLADMMNNDEDHDDSGGDRWTTKF